MLRRLWLWEGALVLVVGIASLSDVPHAVPIAVAGLGIAFVAFFTRVIVLESREALRKVRAERRRAPSAAEDPAASEGVAASRALLDVLSRDF